MAGQSWKILRIKVHRETPVLVCRYLQVAAHLDHDLENLLVEAGTVVSE